jgi:MYXO-CTERM domain-containing protein
MKRLSMRLLTLVAALALLGATQARADKVDYTYQMGLDLKPPVIGGAPDHTGTVSFAVAPNGNVETMPGTADTPFSQLTGTKVAAATLTTTSSAVAEDNFASSPFTLRVGLTDAAGLSGQATFSGTISGNLTGTMSTLVSTFSDPLSKSFVVGNLEYEVTVDPRLLNVPAPGAAHPAEIDAIIKVRDAPLTVSTPEPSSLALGAIALSVLGAATRRRRRSPAAA